MAEGSFSPGKGKTGSNWDSSGLLLSERGAGARWALLRARLDAVRFARQDGKARGACVCWPRPGGSRADFSGGRLGKQRPAPRGLGAPRERQRLGEGWSLLSEEEVSVSWCVRAGRCCGTAPRVLRGGWSLAAAKGQPLAGSRGWARGLLSPVLRFALSLFGEFLSFPFPDGDPNEEDICGWSVSEHYCGGCEAVL